MFAELSLVQQRLERDILILILKQQLTIEQDSHQRKTPQLTIIQTIIVRQIHFR